MNARTSRLSGDWMRELYIFGNPSPLRKKIHGTSRGSPARRRSDTPNADSVQKASSDNLVALTISITLARQTCAGGDRAYHPLKGNGVTHSVVDIRAR